MVHRSQVHDISNIEVINPVIVVLHSQSVTNVDLESLVGLKSLNFLQQGELCFILLRFGLI